MARTPCESGGKAGTARADHTLGTSVPQVALLQQTTEPQRQLQEQHLNVPHARTNMVEADHMQPQPAEEAEGL